MEQNIVTQPVRGDGVVGVVRFIGDPVFPQLLRAENKHGFVAVLVVFDHRQRGKGLAETDAVRQDTAVVFFQLVDDCKHGVTLEIIEHVPNLALLKASRLVRQGVLGNILQKLAEYVV